MAVTVIQDDFTGIDGSELDSAIWEAGSPFEIQSNEATVTVTSPDSKTAKTVYNVSSDFDVYADFTSTDTGTNGNKGVSLQVRTPDGLQAGTIRTLSGQLSVSTFSDGSDGSVWLGAAGVYSGKFRISRRGKQLSFYYDITDSGWTLATSFDWYYVDAQVVLECNTHVAGDTITGTLDNLLATEEVDKSKYYELVKSLNPTIWFPFDESSAARPPANYGTSYNVGDLTVVGQMPQGGTPLTDGTGYSIEFGSGASTGYLTSVQHSDWLNDNQTYNMWIVPEAGAAEERSLYSKGDSTSAGQREFEIDINTDGRISVVTSMSSGYQAGYSSVSVPFGELSMVTVQKVNNTDLKFYINGVYDRTIVKPAFEYGASVVQFGRMTATSTEPRKYRGDMDQFSLWNSILTDEEILELYQVGTGYVEPIPTGARNIWAGDDVLADQGQLIAIGISGQTIIG